MFKWLRRFRRARMRRVVEAWNRREMELQSAGCGPWPTGRAANDDIPPEIQAQKKRRTMAALEFAELCAWGG